MNLHQKLRRKILPVALAVMVSVPLVPATAPSARAALPDIASLVEAHSEPVVSIRAIRRAAAAAPRARLPENHPFFRFFPPEMLPPEFFGGPRNRPSPESQGSGFVLSADGYIFTNAHVIRGSDDVYVTMKDGREFKAEVVGSDERTDIALLKVEADEPLSAVQIGDSDELRVGEWVVAIGSPYGLTQSVTAGIISALRRRLPRENYVPFIQSDAAVNPGNSGGPLMDLQGRVIGINSQILSPVGAFSGVSFSIPINLAMDIQRRLRQDGYIRRARLGVIYKEVDRDTAAAFGLEEPAGALVQEVVPNSPAAKSGVRSGDIILNVDGEKVDDAYDLPPLIGNREPDSEVMLNILREGEEILLAAVLDEMPDPARESDSGFFGLKFGDLDEETRRRENVENGALIVEVNPAEEGAPRDMRKFRPGDIVVGALINRRLHAVTDRAELTQLLAGVDGGTIAFQIVRQGRQLYITVNLDLR